MFLPTRGTPYDLRFSLAGIPVTVSPFFWVTAGLLGWYWLNVEPGGPANLIAWVLCVLVSILLHEFGHAFMMKTYGHDPEIVLHHFGGYATYRGRETPGRSLVITAAGPGIQLALYAVLVGVGLSLVNFPIDWAKFFSPRVLLDLQWVLPNAMADSGRFERGTPLYAVMSSLLFINLFWPLLNLLPVIPLDGGRMLHSILALAGVEAAADWTLKTGVGVGVVAAVFFLLFTGNFIAGAMFAFMAMDNYQTLKGQQLRPW